MWSGPCPSGRSLREGVDFPAGDAGLGCVADAALTLIVRAVAVGQAANPQRKRNGRVAYDGERALLRLKLEGRRGQRSFGATRSHS
jgi:hypothetical protein